MYRLDPWLLVPLQRGLGMGLIIPHRERQVLQNHFLSHAGRKASHGFTVKCPRTKFLIFQRLFFFLILMFKCEQIPLGWWGGCVLSDAKQGFTCARHHHISLQTDCLALRFKSICFFVLSLWLRISCRIGVSPCKMVHLK